MNSPLFVAGLYHCLFVETRRSASLFYETRYRRMHPGKGRNRSIEIGRMIVELFSEVIDVQCAYQRGIDGHLGLSVW